MRLEQALLFTSWSSIACDFLILLQINDCLSQSFSLGSVAVVILSGKMF